MLSIENSDKAYMVEQRNAFHRHSLISSFGHGVTELANCQKARRARFLLRKFLGSRIFSFHLRIPLNFSLMSLSRHCYPGLNFTIYCYRPRIILEKLYLLFDISTSLKRQFEISLLTSRFQQIFRIKKLWFHRIYEFNRI